jgi:hypothetical protein
MWKKGSPVVRAYLERLVFTSPLPVTADQRRQLGPVNLPALACVRVSLQKLRLALDSER